MDEDTSLYTGHFIEGFHCHLIPAARQTPLPLLDHYFWAVMGLQWDGTSAKSFNMAINNY